MIILFLGLVLTSQALIQVDNTVESDEYIPVHDDYTDSDSFVIFTVATDANDPYNRFVRSLKVFDMDKYLKVRVEPSLLSIKFEDFTLILILDSGNE